MTHHVQAEHIDAPFLLSKYKNVCCLNDVVLIFHVEINIAARSCGGGHFTTVRWNGQSSPRGWGAHACIDEITWFSSTYSMEQ